MNIQPASMIPSSGVNHALWYTNQLRLTQITETPLLASLGDNLARTQSSLLVFPATAAVSGLFSGLSGGDSLGAILPGVFFGFAMGIAIHRSVCPLTHQSRMILVGSTTVAFFAAMIVSLLSFRLSGGGNGNGLGAATVSFALGGSAGALVTWAGIAIVCREFRAASAAVMTSFAGGMFGAFFALAGIWISDHTPLGSITSHVASFLIWQTGMATAFSLIAIKLPKSSETSEV